MSIATEVEDLQTNLANAKSAVTERGGVVSDSGLAGLAAEIQSIPSGGGAIEVPYTDYAPQGASESDLEFLGVFLHDNLKVKAGDVVTFINDVASMRFKFGPLQGLASPYVCTFSTTNASFKVERVYDYSSDGVVNYFLLLSFWFSDTCSDAVLWFHYQHPISGEETVEASFSSGVNESQIRYFGDEREDQDGPGLDYPQGRTVLASSARSALQTQVQAATKIEGFSPIEAERPGFSKPFVILEAYTSWEGRWYGDTTVVTPIDFDAIPVGTWVYFWIRDAKTGLPFYYKPDITQADEFMLRIPGIDQGFPVATQGWNFRGDESFAIIKQADGWVWANSRNSVSFKTRKNLFISQEAAAPTASTAGTVGQLYEDTSGGGLYMCTAVDGSTYTWRKLAFESE